MPELITFTREEIIHQLKITCQILPTANQMVMRKVIMDAAEEKGIKIDTDELQQAADNLRLLSNLRSAEATKLWLQENKLSLDDFEEMVYNTAISARLAQHLFGELVESYFVEHQLDYAKVVMYEVVFDDKDLAMELYYSLQEGEVSFHEIAHQYIEDKELRRAGGYRGKLSRSEIRAEIAPAVFAANPPQILKPIITSKGAHLILVEEIIQPKLDALLHSQILSQLFSEWLKEQTQQMEVQIQLD